MRTLVSPTQHLQFFIMRHVLVFGLGYCGTAIAQAAAAGGDLVTATSRDPSALRPPIGVKLIDFADARSAIDAATHVIATAAPDGGGDPVLARYGSELATAPALRWAGYLSTTGVYGDRGGAWVDEDSPLAPLSDRAIRRVAAETAWRNLTERINVDIFRLAGIYGPGRSAFDDLRAGRARRVVEPDHLFGRIHRDDIAAAVLAGAASAGMNGRRGARVFNLCDDEPAASADVIAEAARLVGMEIPPGIPFEKARAGMSPMALAFWADNRKVSSAKTKAALNLSWRYPTYREGLAGILAEESAIQERSDGLA